MNKRILPAVFLMIGSMVCLQAQTGAPGPARRTGGQENLRRGLQSYLLGDHPTAEAALRLHLRTSTDRAGLAEFFLGACLIQRSFLQAERTHELLEDGLKHFRNAKESWRFRLPSIYREYVSPKILEIYNKMPMR